MPLGLPTAVSSIDNEDRPGTGAGSFVAGDTSNAATGTDSFVAGGLGNTASGPDAHAEGILTTASGQAAHSEGDATTAAAIAAHAEGTSTQANNNAAHSEGTNTQANGVSSHAEGSASQANADNSHAEGQDCVVNNTGLNGHAEGEFTVVNAEAAHAGGSCSFASLFGQRALAGGGTTGGVTAASVQQTSDIVFRGSTPGAAVNETVLLQTGAPLTDPPTVPFTMTDGKAYTVNVELIARTATGGIKARSICQRACVRRDAGAVVVEATEAQSSFGNAGWAGATMTLTASGGTLAITFGTGAGNQFASHVTAKVSFTETL